MSLWPDPESRTLALNPDDQILYEWFLMHDTLLFSGDFQLISERLNAPDGVNLLANTTVIALGALFTPVTLAFGAGTTFAVLVALNLAVTAVAWYLLFTRTLGASRPAALIGALFCGFAPGMVSQSNSHLHMTAQFLIPAILWCLVALARIAQRRAPVRRLLRVSVLFGVLIAIQVFIGEETLFLAALTLLLVTAIYVARTRPGWTVVRRFTAGLGLAACTAFALLAYPLYVQFLGSHGVRDGVFSAHYFSADLMSFVAFSPLSIAGDESAASLTTGPAEYNSFFGWPLLLVVIGLGVWLRRHALALTCSLSALVMCLFALGPEIVVNGHRTPINGPYTLLEGLPLVDGALPMRFALTAIPLIAVLLVLGWDQARQARLPVARFGIPAAIVAALLPLTPAPLPATDRPPVPTFYTAGHWRECVTPGGVLMPVPPPISPQPEPMRYSTATRTAFAMPGGFFIGPHGPGGKATMGAPQRPTSLLLNEIAKTGQVPQLKGADRVNAYADLAYWKVECVVLTAHPKHDALRQTVEWLIGPGSQLSDATIWRITS